jgi:hypothetical protein
MEYLGPGLNTIELQQLSAIKKNMKDSQFLMLFG